MEAVGTYSRLLAKKSGKQSDEAVLHKREVFQRRRKFITKQRRQRVAFLFVISIAVLHIHSPPPLRSMWCKEQTCYWWEQTVGQTFTTQDRLENFRMTNATFIYLCNEIRYLIER